MSLQSGLGLVLLTIIFFQENQTYKNQPILLSIKSYLCKNFRI